MCSMKIETLCQSSVDYLALLNKECKTIFLFNFENEGTLDLSIT